MSSLIFTLAGNTTSLGLTISNNVNQKNQIIVGSSNDLTITVTNNSGSTVGIPSGTPVPLVPPDQQQNGQGYLYLTFNAALRNVIDLSSATLTSGDGNTWNIQSYSDLDNGEYYALCPTAEILLTADPGGNSLALSLNGVGATGACETSSMTLQYFGLLGKITSPGSTTESVQVVNPPPPALIDLQLVASFAGTYTIPVASSDSDLLPESTLVLMLTNPGSATLVPGGYASWPKANTPVFTVSFQYDNTDGGLTDDPGSLNVSLLDDYGNNWPPSSQQGQTNAPYWTFTLLNDNSPLPHGDVIGIGDNASVSFSITGIQSAAAIGVTPCIISWTGIPGYYDGQMAIDIVKVEPVLVNITSNLPNDTLDLTLTTNPSPQLSVSATNANTVMVMNTNFFQVLPSGNVSSEPVTINPNITTTYTAIATNFSTAQQASASVTVTVTPDTYSLFPKQTIVMWSGDPANLPPGWTLCIGGTMSDGTLIPDLQDRFVVGLGPVLSGSQPNQTGGTFSHSHSLTISAGYIMNSNSPIDGSHYHKSTFRTTMMVSSGHTSHYMVMFGNDNNGTSYSSSTPGANYSVSTNAANNAGAHYHTLPPATTAPMGTHAKNTQPPWYSLAFIIKTF